MGFRLRITPGFVARIIPLLLIALVGWWLWRGDLPFFSPGAIRHAPGILVADEPRQTLATTPRMWSHEGYSFTSLASIDLRARVLSKEHYSGGREADLSRYDLALGWGPMSDQAILDEMTVSQSNRWYYWRYDHAIPITDKAIITHSGNFHMIAADDAVFSTLKSIAPGHVIHLRGQLVRVSAPDGWHWVSSLSRGDTGDGSCEVVWVESLAIEPEPAGK